MIRFTVYGKPQPQGSTRAFWAKKLGRAVITSDNKNLKPWRQQISETAVSLNPPMIARDVPVRVSAVFYFAKPKSAKKRIWMTVKPDGDKLMRSLLDALTGIFYVDDSQVVSGSWDKEYDMPERVEIEIRTL